VTPAQLSLAKQLRADYESLNPDALNLRNSQAMIELDAYMLLCEVLDEDSAASTGGESK
jgi:hypothetical protein